MPLIDWQDLLAATALYLVLEGLMPAIAPARFREAMRNMANTDERVLRVIGVGSMIAGALLLSAVRS
jgi:uncharacterized protein YjeT (DUF2065 family)